VLWPSGRSIRYMAIPFSRTAFMRPWSSGLKAVMAGASSETGLSWHPGWCRPSTRPAWPLPNPERAW